MRHVANTAAWFGGGGANMNRRKFLGTAGPALLASSLFGPTFGRAEAYPSRPIRIVVPGAAGGVLDVVARRLTDPIGRLGVDSRS